MLLGRAEGLTEEKIRHLGDDPLPTGVYEPSEAALVRYAQASARNDPIRDEIYEDFAKHYSIEQQVQLCFVIGLAGLTNRFHRTFLTSVDPVTRAQLEVGCPVQLPAIK